MRSYDVGFVGSGVVGAGCGDPRSFVLAFGTAYGAVFRRGYSCASSVKCLSAEFI